jgi:hypothetical protein
VTTNDLLDRVHDGQRLFVLPEPKNRPSDCPKVGIRLTVPLGVLPELVSILVAPDEWAEYTFDAGTVTHRRAIATAVRRHTDRTVTGVTFSHRVGDGCGCYIATVEPPSAAVDVNGHNI